MDVFASGRLLPFATVPSLRNAVIRPGTDSRHAGLQQESTHSLSFHVVEFLSQKTQQKIALSSSDWLFELCPSLWMETVEMQMKQQGLPSGSHIVSCHLHVTGVHTNTHTMKYSAG